MWNKRLCMNITEQFGVDYERQLEILADTGFDGFFVLWSPQLPLDSICEKANTLGLQFQSLHAPWRKSRDMWHEDEEKAKIAVEELKQCIDACAKYGTQLLVVHAIIGFNEPAATPMGLPRFEQVVTYAREKGVRIALENVEGGDYLAMLMAHFRDDPTVGFCWDTGHEMCYNHSQDMMALYGDRILCTHLNDNLGIRDYEGRITSVDDLHLMPFDGIADWEDIAKRLVRHGFTGPLTFEMKMKSKKQRHEQDIYENMPFAQYCAEVYKRACKVATLVLRYEKTKRID